MQTHDRHSTRTDPWARALAFNAELRDGSRVRVRPITAADRHRIAAALRRMSPQSRYLRFHANREALTEAELGHLSDLDYRWHVAWGAVALDEPGAPGVGAARFVRDAGRPATAEFAVTVVDDWQRRGLGKLLLQTLLVSAAEYGVEVLVGCVLPENASALGLFRRLGGRLVGRDGEALVIEIPVAAAGRRPRASHPRLQAGAASRSAPVAG